MRKLGILILLLSLCSMAHAGDRPAEYVLNRVWNTTNNTIKATISGSMSVDAISTDSFSFRGNKFSEDNPTNDYIFKFDSATDTFKLEADAGGAGSPGGNNQNVQYNTAGAFDGEAGFDYNAATNTLVVPNISFGNITSDTVTLDSAKVVGGLSKHWRVGFISPDAVQAAAPQFCLVPVTSNSLTVTRIDVTHDSDPGTELQADVRYADAFIGLANPQTISSLDTAVGIKTVTSVASGFVSAAVPSGKCVYISFDAVAPNVTTKVLAVDITYDYD